MISSPNLGYQRYTNLVKLNDVSIYDQQKKKFIDKGGSLASSVSIKLVNPYLVGLLGGEYTLYPPAGSLCDSNSIFGGRGDEISVVPIKFSRVPRKQILNFAIKTPSAMGTLSKGFFHPNSGLIIGDPNFNNKTSINNDSTNNSYYIDYDKDYFRSSATFNSGSIFIGDITPSFKKTIDQVNNLDNHKKLRLYLQLSDGWYEYSVPNTFGFINQNNLYVGEPYVFEYLKRESHSISVGPWIPSCPKKPIEFDFLYNFYPTGKSMAKFTMMYETVNGGVTSIQNNFQNIPVNLFSKSINQLLEGDTIIIPDFKDETIATYGLKYIADESGCKSGYLFSIKTIDDKFVGVSFKSFTFIVNV
jgi:hypothetical protein